jgi:starch-binding outer membrane protein, SusD/RagB family
MNYFRYILLLTCTVVGISCIKKKYLEDDPNSSAIKTLADCQSLLNNTTVFNETPVLGEISSDSYFIDADFLQNLSKPEINAYTWQVDIFEGQRSVADYSIPYTQVHIANQVLAALLRIRISEVEQAEKNNIEGTAYFFRANAFYNLLQLFAMPYESATASSDYGIALPLTPDINTIYKRASLKDSYDQVITDLLQARKLLIANVYHNQPSKPAADALLARVFLSMRDYVNAANYADSCLKQYNTLMNYNTLDPSAKYPIPYLNDEILYYSNLLSSNGIILAKVGYHSIVDTTLYASYEANDLRKKIFFLLDKNQPVYGASYTGNVLAFSGLATDEVYLIRAECRARTGNIQGALDDVNFLLKDRYKTGTFQPYNAASIGDVVQLILEERKKELIFRGLRFTDLRRLNKEGAGIWLRRITNGKIYQLPPNDLRYTFPFPADAIATSKIVQNPRE